MADTRVGHTPGPWVMEQSSDTDWEIAPSDATGQPDWTREVCMVVSSEADARLVVAAPKLLSALKAMVDYYGMVDRYSDPLKVARAAIAKAEGR